MIGLVNKKAIAQTTPKPQRFTLTKIERVGIDAAEKAMDMYLGGKKYKDIAEYFQGYGHDITINDVSSFLQKYEKIRKKALSTSQATRKAVMVRREKYQGKCEKIIDMAETQLETIKSSQMSEGRRAGALSVMAKTMLEAIKTSTGIDPVKKGGGTTVNVGIVQQVSAEKKHLRNEILKADFSTGVVDWDEYDVEEPKEDAVKEEFPEDAHYDMDEVADEN